MQTSARSRLDRRLHVADDALFDQHRARGYHPERPERLGAARRAVEHCAAAGIAPLPVPARDATDEEILRAHAPGYLAELARMTGHYAALDADTYLAPPSVAAARRGAGASIALTDALLIADPHAASTSVQGVALLRPPGHHATRDRGMGFCLFNNAAIAAYAALDRGLSRVTIVDWDVHHGNGTQDIFWDDPRVLYVSLHERPLYPGSGAAEETGGGDGEGFTVNVPLSANATDAVYGLAFDTVVLPVLRQFAPELVLVSAGFDAHERDPLASMRLTAAAYASMARGLAEVADGSAGGRLGMLLEGGYDLTAIEESLAAALRAAAGGRDAEEQAPLGGEVSAAHRAEVEAARRTAARRWRL